MISWPSRFVLALALVVAAMAMAAWWIARDLYRPMPELPRPATNASATAADTTPAGVRDIFTPTTLAEALPGTNASNPFFTTYFEPPPKPVPVTPPPKRTREVELAYQGFYETDHGDRKAYVRVGTNLVVAGLGAKLVANLTVSNITFQALTLTQAGTQETVVPFRGKKEVSVPIE